MTAGHIVTNYHVIANADSVLVALDDGRVANARVVGRDPDTDLAVLKIDLTGLQVATFGHSDRLQVGDVVLAIGSPMGLSQTVTHGIVSATGRQHMGVANLEDFIQTDAPINSGNSGGALVDSSGALIGINTAMAAKSLGVEGIGFAIPVNMVRGVVSDIIANGRVIRGWLGIVAQDITNEQAAAAGPCARGRAAGLCRRPRRAGGPAVRGTCCSRSKGLPVTGAQDAYVTIAAHKPGSTLAIKVLRGRKMLDIKATVGERPHQP